MKYVLIIATLFLLACAREQVDYRFIVWDKELKKVLYCSTEQECERNSKNTGPGQ